MSRYMLILKGGNEDWSAYTPEQAQAMMQKYFEWSQEIAQKGFMKAGDALKEGGRELSVSGGSVVDGPYAETKETIAGYYVIEATDYDHAVEVARGCPALLHNGSVEIREIQEF